MAKTIKDYYPEVKEINTESPINYLKIGKDFLYSGNYINGHEEGVSKIKRFYCERFFHNNKPKKLDKNSSPDPMFMELENSKIILLGFIDYQDNFTTSNSFDSLMQKQIK